MSVGRTFGLQASWDEVMRAMAPEGADPRAMRNAIDAADSMNRQIEEFINRYTVRSTTDGDTVTFDSAGTYVFQGDITLDGGDIQTSTTGARLVLTEDGSGGALGLTLPSLLVYTGAEDAPAQIQAQTVSTTHTFWAYSGADDTGGDANPAYWSLSSNGTGRLGIGTAGGPSLIFGDRYAAVADGSASAPGLAFQGDLDTGAYLYADGVFGIAAASAVISRWGSSAIYWRAAAVPATGDATLATNHHRLYINVSNGQIVRRSTAGV